MSFCPCKGSLTISIASFMSKHRLHLWLTQVGGVPKEQFQFIKQNIYHNQSRSSVTSLKIMFGDCQMKMSRQDGLHQCCLACHNPFKYALQGLNIQSYSSHQLQNRNPPIGAFSGVLNWYCCAPSFIWGAITLSSSSLLKKRSMMSKDFWQISRFSCPCRNSILSSPGK